jgi:hypothetical protein
MSEWRPINDRYEVSSAGQVRSLAHTDQRGRPWPGKMLKPYKTGKDRKYLCVQIDRKNHKVHRLVALAFVSPVEGKPHVNHKDGDTFNNAASNLEWVTQQENVVHAFQVLGKASSGGHKGKLGAQHHCSKAVKVKSQDGQQERVFGSGAEAARFIGCAAGAVPRTCNGQQKTAKGWLCEYI